MKKLLIIAALGALVLTACKEEVTHREAIWTDSITLDCESLEIPIGEIVKLNATVLPENTDKLLYWLSDKPEIATVSEDGEVTAKAPGEAIILAVAGKASAVCHVCVFRPIDELTLSDESIRIPRKETFLLQATVLPEDATEIIKWSSDKPEIAIVDEDGLVKGLEEGEAVITAKTLKTSVSCSVTVFSTHVTDISLSGPAEIWLGHEETITATLTPSDATDDIEWSSDKPEIASVEDGVVKGLALGEATITASVGEISATLSITVVPVPVKEVSIEPTVSLMEIGKTVQLSAIILPEDATDKSVTWSSEDESIALVDENGLVTAVAVGDVHIYATAANGVSGSALINVKEEIKIYTLPYYEDFESYNNESIREDWTFIDADGDGYEWELVLDTEGTIGCHSGTATLASASYVNNYGALQPDNWVFTPPIKLDEADNVLDFWLVPQDGSWPAEHYAAYISTSISTENCMRLVEGSLTEGQSYIYTKPSQTSCSNYKPMAVGNYEHIIVDIPDDFNGEVVYFAFRHFDCTDFFRMNLDDVSVSSASSPAPAPAPSPTFYKAPHTSLPGANARKIVR